MRVLFVNSFFAPAVGGVETFLSQVGAEFVSRGHSVTILTSQHDPKLPLRETIGGVEVFRYPYRFRDAPWSMFEQFRRGWACRRGSETVFGESSFDWILARDLPSLMGVSGPGNLPVTVYFQPVAYPVFHQAAYRRAVSRRGWRGVYDRIDQWVQIKTTGFVERYLISRVAQRVVPSRSKRTEISTFYGFPESFFRVVNPGVDLEVFTPAGRAARSSIRSELELPEDACLFLFVGRFSAEKNPDGLVRAFSMLPTAHPVGLVMIGPNPDSTRSLAEALDLPGPIFFPGPIQDPAKWYQACDVLALPSLSDGHPLVLLEAMACGLPCVAFSPPAGGAMLGTEEIVLDGETGRLVPYQDYEAFTFALGTLAEDSSAREAMGKRGRARVEEAFSWKRVADDLEALSPDR